MASAGQSILYKPYLIFFCKFETLSDPYTIYSLRIFFSGNYPFEPLLTLTFHFCHPTFFLSSVDFYLFSFNFIISEKSPSPITLDLSFLRRFIISLHPLPSPDSSWLGFLRFSQFLPLAFNSTPA
ncbi:unnamed protein product [Cuscuta epithymum]|uniref:Uncharacterized protein n=1 Tax=Cuscuta epithymum TaxID=186058 RepID=A0AAV0FGW3_9ASTE|nr:unnamed protein product [Cuscuta epithymum]